ncbi:MAG: rod shape-determining protein MreD [Bacillota bacterium]|jgi:rod shape-determining protein MreD|nr:rod shape-determining protein MreD [Bacillota bacterium]MDI9415868.1 rod shape-determining protein MreD [Bacillota bacterium]NLD12168.1 rod shape-determining protein MreD [Bacillota bacterium]HAV21726.1 rod shape-determining protein MreD [Bacillota bacterium]HOB88319.1 rod shape-determining protein MreD [Bacillota bacterium]
MRYWALGILTVLVVVLETTAIPYISIGGIGPDIVGSLVTLVSMLSGREMGLFVALVGGVLEDVSSGQFLGLFVLVRGVVACLAGMAYQKVFQEWVLVPVILVFGAAVAGGILQVFLLASFGVPFESYRMALSTVVFQAVYSALLSPIVMRIISTLDAFVSSVLERRRSLQP